MAGFVSLADFKFALMPEDQVQQTLVCDLYALGLAGRTGRVNYVRRLTVRNRVGRGVVRVLLALSIAFEVDDFPWTF